jgi:hypothetical protein
VFREKGYRFFFFSREEPRAHVHIHCSDGEAKFWLEPGDRIGEEFSAVRSQINENDQIIEGHYDDRELFMSYDQFPWFKDAPLGKILKVEQPTPGHFYCTSRPNILFVIR